MRRVLLAVLSLAAITLVVAGCGDDKSSDTTSAASSEATTSTAADSSSGKGTNVKIKDIQFWPKNRTAKVGETITWTNEDAVAHNVIANDGADFKSDTLNQGDTFEYTPKKAGTIKYECTIHPGQDGTITVS